MQSALDETPRTLQYRGRSITFSGKGRALGTVVYLDGTRQKLLEVYRAAVVTTGPEYSVLSIPGNPAIGKVRVEHIALSGHGVPHVGDVMLIGELEFGPLTEAKAAWLIRNRSMPGREFGTVIYTQHSWGKISRDNDGAQIYVHETQMRDRRTLRVGARVSYVSSQNERGLAAFDVRAA